MDSNKIIKIKNVNKTFYQRGINRKQMTNALRDVSIDIEKGEVLGLVGESGSGKTTLGKIIVGLLQPDSGEVFFRDDKVSNLSIRKFRPYRKNIQMIFQNPYASLNPSMPVYKIFEEPLKMNGNGNDHIENKLKNLLKQVNLNESKLDQLPKHLSGGERRRVGMARILAVEPKVIILDEPVAALDQSIKEQIIQLLTKMQKSKGLTYLWISHDLLTIEYVSHRIAIMYHGIIVETLKRNSLKNLQHPYSIELFSASKFMANQTASSEDYAFNKILSEEKTDYGCPYRNRCIMYKNNNYPDICKNQIPKLKYIENDHQIACHLV
jgi:ABC-type oligopeptide transport system ATPase subunit